MKTGIIVAIFLFIAELVQSQTSDTIKTFNVSLEFRPRVEFRNGYKQLRNDTTTPAYFGTQRSRILFDFKQKYFKFHTSIQDIRVWGQYGLESINGSLSVFEAYVELNIKSNWLLRIGRQNVQLDNGRLFSKSNWSQASKAHDGLNLIFKTQKINSQLMFFFNQTSERIYETDYSPSSFSNYKILSVHYFNVKLSEKVTLTTLNSADGYQSLTNKNVLYVRGNSGGRIEFTHKYLYLTLSGYYQYGNISSGNKVESYYLQPEIKYAVSKKITSSLGCEYVSGDDASKNNSISRSFVPLYGVTHKFMGNMDYFTKFPNDVKNGGLINPYLFLTYKISKKLSIRTDEHLFYLQNKVIDNNKVINPYLGFENDLSLKYKFNEFITFDFGFSFLLAEKSMEILKAGNSNKNNIWSFVMITFNPELFNSLK